MIGDIALDLFRMAQYANARATRAGLLAAAIDHFTATGLTGHTLRSIAAALGTSHRMLQYHFGSKEALVAEVLEAVRDDMVARAGAISLEGLLDSEAVWATLVGQPEAGAIMYQGLGLALAEPEHFGSYAQTTFDSWYSLVAGLLASQGRADPGGATATALVGALRGLFLDLVTTGDTERVKAAFDHVVAVFGLAADGGSS